MSIDEMTIDKWFLSIVQVARNVLYSTIVMVNFKQKKRMCKIN